MGSIGEFIMLITILAATMAAEEAKPGCQSQCGNLTVPYPFGMEQGCFMESKFFIRCDTSNTTEPPKAFLNNSTIDVLDIDLNGGELRVRNWVGYDCYDLSGSGSFQFETWLRTGLYNISSTKNKFTAIGCDTIAFIMGSTGQAYATGCFSLCNEIGDVTNGSCSGIGCCQANIPRGVRDYNISLTSSSNHSGLLTSNPCSYGFVVEDGEYEFSTSDLNRTDVHWKLPMVLDWTIGNQNCSEAKKGTETYSCKENSICREPEFGNGYLCRCSDGFEGNPYLSNGCRDEDECETLKPCTSACHNTFGGFYCSCPKGYDGDGHRNGTGCSPKVKGTHVGAQIAIGTSIGFLVIFVFISWSLAFKQRKTAKMREKYFNQNGGNLLQQLSKSRGSSENDKIFAAAELNKATDSFHESRILGQGGQATVYKGTLPGNKVVAIKKSRIGDQSQVEPFINEIMVLYQINHKHVVKLLGCCLETPVPLLVYEYVTHGSLFDHIHDVVVPGAAPRSFLMWETRLRIAMETAEALAYLHSAASIPIIHRDVKLANILLDENYTAKVSDFGASRLALSDQAQMTTMLQGTFGYLDPECMHTGQLTEKSDVYSFGVVLIELLTGRKALCGEGPEEEKVLAKYFVSLMKEERLHDIVDARMLNNNVEMEQVKEVAALARECVRVKGEERPTMKEVAHELAGLKAMERYQWGKRNLQVEESEYLLGDELSNIYADYGTTSSIGYDSIKNQVAFELDGAR
ncbi:gibberellin 20 oxidase 2 [Hibiscus syriacus]|uniref:Gibberellin 20 oxidase 2 n=2 Tax=Hibiscus syriacus TaxID=106335 RepID=A0A6A3BT64_HIBSY|nr:gibberellin 20 oxidase 2 [Hibiscus syriacus]